MREVDPYQTFNPSRTTYHWINSGFVAQFEGPAFGEAQRAVAPSRIANPCEGRPSLAQGDTTMLLDVSMRSTAYAMAVDDEGTRLVVVVVRGAAGDRLKENQA